MHWGSASRRVTAGVFLVALTALLVVPAGSAPRAPQTQAVVGSPQTKATALAARTHDATLHLNPSDRWQLDPTTLTAGADEPPTTDAASVDHFSQPSTEGRHGDPTVRGPPAL